MTWNHSNEEASLEEDDEEEEPKLCPLFQKVQFTRKQNARVAAERHWDRDRTGVYRCYNCRYWHVGHWEFVKVARLIKQARMERDWTW